MTDNRPVPGTIEHRDMRRRQLGCGCASLAVIAMVILATGYICLFRSVRLRISKETTRVTEPLKADGKQVDYLAAWEQQTYPEKMATEENGYRLLVQHLGPAPEASPEHYASICQKLGLDPEDIRPDMTFEEPADFVQRYVASEEFDESLIERLVAEGPEEDGPIEPNTVLQGRYGRPWTLKDLPMMEAWLTKNAPAIDLIGEAVRKPLFHIPLAAEGDGVQLLTMLLPEIQQTRLFARGLSTRAHHRIGMGNVDGAIDDVVACKRFGRRAGQGGSLIRMLVGIAIEGIADSIGIAGSLEHPPTKEQLERLVAELKDLPAKPDFETAMEFERYMGLDIIQAVAWGEVSGDELELPTEILGVVGIDWNVVARRFNEDFDVMVETGFCPAPSWSLLPIVSTRARSELMADLFGNFVLPASDAAHEATRRSTCVDRMHRITLAMLLYECDHGTLPPAFTVDADGNPLHSWRVLLLPYLDQQELHDKIRLGEPWDSEHNRQFHKQAVAFYQCPSAELAPGDTTYAVVVEPDMPFEAGEGKTLSDFGPNSANMVLVVEGIDSACWMDPMHNVSQADGEKGINGSNGVIGVAAAIGSAHPGGANFGFRNGGVQFVSETIDFELLKDLLQGAAGSIP